MNIDQLKQETDKLKQIDTAQLSPEQLMELIDKLATLIDTGEQHISEIKIEDNEDYEYIHSFVGFNDRLNKKLEKYLNKYLEL